MIATLAYLVIGFLTMVGILTYIRINDMFEENDADARMMLTLHVMVISLIWPITITVSIAYKGSEWLAERL